MDKSLQHYYGQPAEQYDIHGQQLPPAVLEIPGLNAGQPQSVTNVPNRPNMQNVNVQAVPSQSMAINMNLSITAAPPVNVAQNSLANGVNQSLHPGLQNGGILNMANMANNSQYYSGALVNPIISQDLRGQSLPASANHSLSGSHGVAGKFSDGDVELLHQLYSMGERHKWKQITKEINQRSALRRGDDISGVSDDERNPLSKNVSPTYVIKQYQNLFGLPKNQNYFGVLGLSVPYVVSEKGWDDLADTEKFSSPE